MWRPLNGASLFGRVAIGIVVGFLLLHAGTLVYYNHEKLVDQAGDFAAGMAERALAIASAANGSPELLAQLSTPSFSLAWRDTPLSPPRRVWPHTEEVRPVLESRLAALDYPDPSAVGFWYVTGMEGRQLVLQLPVGDKLLVVHAAGPDLVGHSMIAAVWTTAFGGVVLLAVLWSTRRFTRALPRLAEAAEGIGRFAAPVEIEERGPREIRRLTRAFNVMSSRVTGLLAERNAMLAALSHDVRTLVTRLSLRLESVEDPELRRRSREDVETITSLLDEALGYARDEAGLEEPVSLDLASLLQSLLDDQEDLGGCTQYCGPPQLIIRAPPTAMRRLFGNLLDNARRYGGGSVKVSARRERDEAIVDVEDQGPGIAPEDQAGALQPFVRLEPSRNRETGGSGLGLSIAHGVAERQGGTLSFPATAEGFVVRVVLPLRPAPCTPGTRSSG
jgi:signal transduction histidine kinase